MSILKCIYFLQITFSSFKSWQVNHIVLYCQWIVIFFMLRNGTPFSDRKVVKDSKVKARYHHLIAHSFVEVGGTKC